MAGKALDVADIPPEVKVVPFTEVVELGENSDGTVTQKVVSWSLLNSNDKLYISD